MNEFPVTEDQARRFWAKVQKTDGCWLWTGSTQFGYGRINRNHIPALAHRVSWAIHNGKIPDGLCVLHRCDVRSCVRPDHLFIGTYQDNVDDMVAKGRHGCNPARTSQTAKARAACRLGHLYEEVGFYWSRNSRICKACFKVREMRYLSKKRAS